MNHRLVRSDTGDQILAHVELADSFFRRFVGLQLRRSLPKDHGLLLSPCSSLHTCFMRFPIDVVMLDHEGRVLGTKSDVRPWRIALCAPGTKSVLETNVGATELPVGCVLKVQ